MFEYLMPLLVMPTYREHAARPDLPGGRRTGRSTTASRRGVPWGISESGYNTTDAHMQLSVPGLRRAGLGLQAGSRRRSGDRAVRLGPGADGGDLQARARTCSAMAADGFRGATASTRPSTYTPVAAGARTDQRRRAFVHGPSSGDEPARPRLTCAGRPMQKPLCVRPLFQATTLLLQERVPKASSRSIRSRSREPSTAPDRGGA